MGDERRSARHGQEFVWQAIENGEFEVLKILKIRLYE